MIDQDMLKWRMGRDHVQLRPVSTHRHDDPDGLRVRGLGHQAVLLHAWKWAAEIGSYT